MSLHPLLVALRARTNVPDDEFEEYISMSETRHYKKNEHLLKQGDIPRLSNFIVKGCVRTYYVGEDGTERTTYFAEESYWAGDLENMRDCKATQFNVQAIEDTEAVIFTREKWELAYEKFAWFRAVHSAAQQRRAAKLAEHIGHLLTDTPETNYLRLLKQRPALVQRVPQYYIASYIGISPETLSRIRKKLSAS